MCSFPLTCLAGLIVVGLCVYEAADNCNQAVGHLNLGSPRPDARLEMGFEPGAFTWEVTSGVEEGAELRGTSVPRTHMTDGDASNSGSWRRPGLGGVRAPNS